MHREFSKEQIAHGLMGFSAETTPQDAITGVLQCLHNRMAQSMVTLPSETVFVECRAFVFFFDVQLNRWSETAEPNVYSRIQLLCSRPPGSSGLYRIFGRLESSGMITINTTLNASVTYVVTTQDWHQIRVQSGWIYGLRLSPESDGQKFALIVQNAIRSLQGTRVPPLDHMGNWGMPPAAPPTSQTTPSAAPVGMPTGAPSQDGPSVQRRREYDSQIDALCLSLSEAIMAGRQDRAIELVKQMALKNLPLSIKLKNPVFVTMDTGADTINIRVVVEDKESTGGAFSMKVSPTATVERLQQEVFDRYGFPVQVQKWIVGKKIPKPQDTLQDLNVRQSGHTVFLYLLSGKTVGLRKSDAERFGRGNAGATSSPANASSSSSVGVSTTSVTTPTVQTHMRRAVSESCLSGQSERHAPSAASSTQPLPTVNHSPPASLPNQENLSGPATLPATFRPGMTIDELRNLLTQQYGSQGDVANPPEPPPQEAFVNNLVAAEQPAEEDGHPVGWTCSVCTYINQPTRPGCEMCSADRPANYVVPDGSRLDERERNRIAAQEREEALFQQAERMRQQEEQVARERNFVTLLQTAQQSIIPNQEEFDCGICFTPVEPGEGVVLRECLHRFCRDCLTEHIRLATDPEVQCPHQDDDYACHATITGQEIQALLSPQDFNKFLNRSLATAESQAPNSFHCKTPNCPGWCVYEDNVNTFYCPVCKQPNCLTCKAIHADMNCREYQDDLKRRAHNDEAAKQTQQFLEGMVAGGEAMHCPMCDIILMKKEGCDWMRCSMCRTEICWATRGPRWGPAGTGDISGGCKCRVGGKKCHTKCKNCH